MHDGLPWLWPGLITADDPSSLQRITPQGRGHRLFYESWRWREINVYLFSVRYPGVTIEFQVHPELRGPQRRDQEVEYFARMLGRLPAILLQRVEKVSIDIGYQSAQANRERRTLHAFFRMNRRLEEFGCGARPGSTRCEYAPNVGATGSAEEMYIHEAGHMLDDLYLDSACWRNAQKSDGEFISPVRAGLPQPRGLGRVARGLLRAPIPTGPARPSPPARHPGDDPGAYPVHGSVGPGNRPAARMTRAPRRDPELESGGHDDEKRPCFAGTYGGREAAGRDDGRASDRRGDDPEGVEPRRGCALLPRAWLHLGVV